MGNGGSESGGLHRKGPRIPVWLQPNLPTCGRNRLILEMGTRKERWPKGILTRDTILALGPVANNRNPE